MKIAIASDTYYPMTNGVAVFTYNLAKGLAARGHDVLVLVPSFKKKKYVEKDGGLIVQYLTSKRFPFYPDQIEEIPEEKKVLGVKMPRVAYKNGMFLAVNAWFEMEKALDEFQPDVIHQQTVGPTGIAATHYAKKNNVALVTTGHSYPDNYTGQFKLLKPVKKPVDAALKAYMAGFMRHSEYATMPTEMAIDDLVPKNRKRFKVTVEPLSNGVDLSQFRPGGVSAAACKKLGILPSRPRVVYVGRVDPEKSLGTVVEAFSQALVDVPEAEFLIAGDGIDKPRLEKMAQEMGLTSSVRFLGKVMMPELLEVYHAGMVFATASETETQGIVLIEAAATGLPLIAVDAGAVSELCRDGENGILCQPGDVSAMAVAMVKILTDAKLQKKYSKGSLAVAKKHDINHTLARFEEIYQTAVEMKKTA